MIADFVTCAPSIEVPILLTKEASSEFKVIRGSSIIGSGETSIALMDGVDYDIEAVDDQWFFQLANNHFSGMGSTKGETQNAEDFTVFFTITGNDITLSRTGSSGNCRVDWQLIQYIGQEGGPNEFKVREKSSFSLGTGLTTHSFSIPNTVSNHSNVVPFICAQSNNRTDTTGMSTCLYTTEIVYPNIDFTRGSGESDSFVSYAIVEFTGSNWTITNENFTGSTNGSTNITLSIPVLSTNRTFLHCQYRYNADLAGLDDSSIAVYLSSTEQLTYDGTTSVDSDVKNHSVYLIQNPEINVERFISVMAGSGNEEVDDVSITAVPEDYTAYTTLSANSTGSGTAFPRGFVNHILIDHSTVRLRQSDNGQTSDFALEVVRFPSNDVVLCPLDIQSGMDVGATEISLYEINHLMSSGISALAKTSKSVIAQVHCSDAHESSFFTHVDAPILFDTSSFEAREALLHFVVNYVELSEYNPFTSDIIHVHAAAEHPALSQRHTLQTTNSIIENEVDQPSLQQIVAFSANYISISTQVESANLTETNALAAESVLSSPSLGQPSLEAFGSEKVQFLYKGDLSFYNGKKEFIGEIYKGRRPINS